MQIDRIILLFCQLPKDLCQLFVSVFGEASAIRRQIKVPVRHFSAQRIPGIFQLRTQIQLGFDLQLVHHDPLAHRRDLIAFHCCSVQLAAPVQQTLLYGFSIHRFPAAHIPDIAQVFKFQNTRRPLGLELAFCNAALIIFQLQRNSEVIICVHHQILQFDASFTGPHVIAMGIQEAFIGRQVKVLLPYEGSIRDIEDTPLDQYRSCKVDPSQRTIVVIQLCGRGFPLDPLFDRSTHQRNIFTAHGDVNMRNRIRHRR